MNERVNGRWLEGYINGWMNIITCRICHEVYRMNSKVLIALNARITVLWNVTPCSSVDK
jgi:hypothetical protein